MGYIFVDKESGGDSKMREHMRRSMRGGYSPMMHHEGDNYEHGYRLGYRHGWEDNEDDMEMRRSRDSRGRYIYLKLLGDFLNKGVPYSIFEG